MTPPNTIQVLQALIHSAEQDVAGHIMLFRGAVYRCDALGCEREKRLAHEALDHLFGGIGALWREQLGIAPAGSSGSSDDRNGTPTH